MSNPYVNSRGWPIVDRLLAAMFDELVVIEDRDVTCGTVLNWDGTFPAIQVERIPGGGINPDAWQDVNRIVITTMGTSRPESDELLAQVRDLMAEHSNGEYSGVGLDRIFEQTGPGRIPDPNQDLRVIPTTWSVTVRRV